MYISADISVTLLYNVCEKHSYDIRLNVTVLSCSVFFYQKLVLLL